MHMHMASNLTPDLVVSEIMSHLTSTTTVEEDGDESCLDDRSATRLVSKLFRGARPLHQLFVDRYGANGALRHAVGEPQRHVEPWDPPPRTIGSEEKASREATVRGLLEMPHGAPRADADDSVALQWAVAGGQEGIVRLLLEAPVHAAHADAEDSNECALLLIAVAAGHEDIVRLLLEAPVHAARADADDSAALLVAVERGDEGIVRLLLQAQTHAAHADVIPEFGECPLSVAVAGGHEGIVRLLLEAPVHAAQAARADDDDFGRGLLMEAAIGGYEGIVALLVEATPPASLGDFGDFEHFQWSRRCGDLRSMGAYQMVMQAQARAAAAAAANTPAS
jgi:hypothetical protein